MTAPAVQLVSDPTPTPQPPRTDISISAVDSFPEQELRDILNVYRRLVKDVNNQPVISIKDFFVLYGKLVWWELNVIALPFVGLINLLIWARNTRAQTKRRYIPFIAWLYLRDALMARAIA